MLHPPIRRNIKLAEAPSFGETIFDYAPRCAGANDYRNLAQTLLALWDGQLAVGDPEQKGEVMIEAKCAKLTAPQSASAPGIQDAAT